MDNQIFALADDLVKLRDWKKSLDEQLKAANAEIAETEAKLSDAMINEEVPNFSRNGKLFYLSTRTYASPAAGCKAELFAWLRENGFGDLVQETVNANTLSAWAREYMEENDLNELPETLSGLVRVYEKTSVGVRKAKN
ncbi:MAG: hypothetical protein ACOX8W_13035 [bacterium]